MSNFLLLQGDYNSCLTAKCALKTYYWLDFPQDSHLGHYKSLASYSDRRGVTKRDGEKREIGKRERERERKST